MLKAKVSQIHFFPHQDAIPDAPTLHFVPPLFVFRKWTVALGRQICYVASKETQHHFLSTSSTCQLVTFQEKSLYCKSVYKNCTAMTRVKVSVRSARGQSRTSKERSKNSSCPGDRLEKPKMILNELILYQVVFWFLY